MDMMNFAFVINFWFLVSLCLLFLLMGVLLGVRFSRSNQGRYYR